MYEGFNNAQLDVINLCLNTKDQLQMKMEIKKHVYKGVADYQAPTKQSVHKRQFPVLDLLTGKKKEEGTTSNNGSADDKGKEKVKEDSQSDQQKYMVQFFLTINYFNFLFF